MKQSQLTIQFGPYSAYEAEQIAEEILESKELSQSLEHLLKGEVTKKEFLSSLQFLAESIHASVLEKERESRRYEYGTV